VNKPAEYACYVAYHVEGMFGKSRTKRLGVRYARHVERLWKVLDWTVEEVLDVIAYARQRILMLSA